MNRFRPYFHYLRPLRGQLVLGMICLGIYSFATGYWLPKIVPDVFGPIFNDGERLRSISEVALLSLSIPAVFLLRGLAGYASTYLFQFIGTRVLEALRLDFFRKLQSLPLSYLQKHPAGEFTSRAMNDAQQVQYVITALASDGTETPAHIDRSDQLCGLHGNSHPWRRPCGCLSCRGPALRFSGPFRRQKNPSSSPSGTGANRLTVVTAH